MIFGVIFGFKYFGLDQYLTFEYIKANQAMFSEYYANNKALTIGIYFIGYVAATALSLPGATILTLLGGALFGLTTGFVVISFASTIGASLAFLISRTLLRDTIQSKYANKLKSINEGVKKDGAFYLFTLRLVPVVPFFLINILMGLTPISLIKYFFVSQLGMLPGTLVYVNAGVQLGQLDSLSGILSPGLLLSFTLLGIFPIIAKKIVNSIKARKVYKGYKKPKNFEYNMVVIGAGSGGLVASLICAAVKAKVALIERDKMGGDCLNTGCVPSKAIIKSAKVAHQINTASKYGISSGPANVDFPAVMERIQSVIKTIEPHDSVERFTDLGVDCIQGSAKIISPWEVQVGDRVITAKNITIATGASPFVPPIPGIADIDYLVSDNLWDIREQPKNFVVLGAGPIGLEMAQSFQRLGSNVTVIEMGSRILPREDEDVSEELTKILRSEGVDVLLDHKAVQFKNENGKQSVVCENSGESIEIEFDKVLIAVGRRANVKGFGLEELGVNLRNNGTIEANEYLETNFPNIYVCGDVTGPFQLTHAASHQSWYCAVNALFKGFKNFKVDYRFIPWCTYLEPEVASIGKNEMLLKEEGVEFDVIKYGLDDLDRAIADGATDGFVKVMMAKGSDTILGVTIVGANAGELLTEFVTTMKLGKGLNSILGTTHSYPTMSEGNKFAAGIWKRENAPMGLLKYVEKFHAWRRS